jgi:hypothetical protein
MAEAERHGRAFGCHSAWVDTFTFQGPNFYPKLGYVEFARIDYPPDHQRFPTEKTDRRGGLNADASGRLVPLWRGLVHRR